MPATIASLLETASDELRDSGDTPRLEAELLLAHALGCTRTRLHAHPEETPDDGSQEAFARLVAARRKGEPIAYLTGEREFWSLKLKITPATLIPRPETELLVEQALRRIPADAEWRLLDLGTGSGALALALASERPCCRVTATDVSAAALRVARENASSLGLQNLEFLQGHWYVPLGSRRFHLVVSNPPYVKDGDTHLQQGDLRFEPRAALASGQDGLEAIRSIVQRAPRHLERGGAMYLEHGLDQADAVRALLRVQGFSGIETFHDLQGHERASGGIWERSQAPG
ncbi:MAG TPA: peptide chain release factor N(5)-glutamine methyltransferase [Gammaproteobacteria bacterium]|nr:peptide chain release factor N(5)-glutamine methyltransferase [Gammaproteobacteria bacterium]